MAMAFFRQHFIDSHPGRMAGTQLLANVVELSQEPDLTEESRAQLKDIGQLTRKKRYVSVLMSGRTGMAAYYAVTLLADKTNLPVCFVNCRQWTESFIGETEKNLARLFSEAQTQQWILFFDEADALFTKHGHRSEFDQYYFDVDFLAKLLSTHQGLVVFSVTESHYTDKLTPLFSQHLHFN